jgi:alkyl sulfatase BDS1-like metallo-beta-lactamase superfamily hydrolase
VDEVTPERKLASQSTEELQRAVRASIATASGSDFERATRGMIAPGTPRQVSGRYGQVLWDLDAYAFLDDPTIVESPSTVNPSLWRQGRLNNIAGLFEVTPSIFQVRGMDISNVTFISGETGWIVIDPLTSEETARAALDMVNEHLGERPVRAVIYTHSHTDHFGGVHGVVSDDDVASGRVAVIAPVGFLDAAVSENVLAGTVMIRRATYMYGVLLPKDEQGHVDTGLGKGMPSLPSVALVAPTREITTTGEESTIDGVRLIFQITPGTEAPAEMNVFVPDERALCMAENCTANQHNVYTLRGAQVRDALMWSKYIDQSLELYADECDVLFASHHWPRWGGAELSQYLASQRDAYRYVHDQTLRLANHGLTMNEIAEELEMPEGVEFVNHVVFADPANVTARLLQADALEQLGYRSESGPWRDFYLSGAMELRSNGTVLKGLPDNALGSGVVGSMTPELLLDLIGVRLNGPRCVDFEIEIELVITDRGDERWSCGVRNGVLHARRNARNSGSVGVISSLSAFAIFATGSKNFDELLARDDFEVAGDVSRLREFVEKLDVFEFGFEIVLP